MSFDVALETIVITDKAGGEKNCSVTHVILPFGFKSDADNFIQNYDAFERPKDFISIYRTATRLY